MNPLKLAQLLKGELITKVAEEYAREVSDHEMPHGLMQYVELELFPRIQVKCKKGISLITAC
jgi:hypothetical protein